jgi:hypothetical protein
MYKSETYYSFVRKKTRNIVLHSGAIKARKNVIQERSYTAGPQSGTFPAQYAPLDLNLGPA